MSSILTSENTFNMQSPQKSNEPRKRTRTRGGRKLREKKSQQSCKKEGMLFGNLDPVSYDKKVDAPPGACLNCRSFRHKHKDCTNPKIQEYCCNCGRRGFAVDECPRCARAFHALDHVMKSWIYDRFFDDEPSYEKQVLEKKESGGDEIWYEEEKPKKESRGEEYWDDYSENNCHSPSVAIKDRMSDLRDEDFDWKSYHSRETAYVESHDRESMENLNETRMDSLDEIPIASKKNEELRPSTGDPSRDYLRLLEALKHLSVEAQNVVVLQFVAERKKLMDEKEAQIGIASETS